MSSNMISTTKKLKVTDLNSFLICVLCKGYYVDATTIVECLHSFCKTCIVKYLSKHKYCPICEVLVYKTKPLSNIRPDQRLQNVVYKLIPGLYEREMQRRRHFFSQVPNETSLGLSGEERGIITESSEIILPDENISITLEYLAQSAEDINKAIYGRRYLRCKASAPLSILHKFLRNKFNLSNKHCVQLVCNNEILMGNLSVVDVAYIHQWKKQTPMFLGYRILETKVKRLGEIEEIESCKRLKLENNVPKTVHRINENVEDSKANVDGQANVEAKASVDKFRTTSNGYKCDIKVESSSAQSLPIKSEPISNHLLHNVTGRSPSVGNLQTNNTIQTSNEWKEVELKINDLGEMKATPISLASSLANTTLPSNTSKVSNKFAADKCMPKSSFVISSGPNNFPIPSSIAQTSTTPSSKSHVQTLPCVSQPHNHLLNLTTQPKPYAIPQPPGHQLPTSAAQLTNFLVHNTTFANLMPRMSDPRNSKSELTVTAVSMSMGSPLGRGNAWTSATSGYSLVNPSSGSNPSSIGNNSPIGNSPSIGSSSSICSTASMGNSSSIDSSLPISNAVSISSTVSMANSSSIRNRTSIGLGLPVGNTVSISNSSSIGNIAHIGNSSSIINTSSTGSLTSSIGTSSFGISTAGATNLSPSNRALVYPMVQEPRATTHTTFTNPSLKLPSYTPRASRPRAPQPRYKTLKTGVQPWNPTVSRSKVTIGNCDPLKPQENVSKIFKSRNNPSYSSPTPNSPSPPAVKSSATETPKVRPTHPSITKIDPRTLSPIVPGAVSTSNSIKSDSPTYISTPSPPSHLTDKHKFPRPNPFLHPSLFYPGFLPYSPDNPLLPNTPDFMKAMSALYQQQNPAFHSSLPPSISTLFNHHLPSTEKKSPSRSSSSPVSNHIPPLSLPSSISVSPTTSAHPLSPSLKSYIPLNSISNSKASSVKAFSPVKSFGGKDKSPTSVNSIFSPVNMITSKSPYSPTSSSPSSMKSSLLSLPSSLISSPQPLSLVTTCTVTTPSTPPNPVAKDGGRGKAASKVTPVVSTQSHTNTTTTKTTSIPSCKSDSTPSKPELKTGENLVAKSSEAIKPADPSGKTKDCSSKKDTKTEQTVSRANALTNGENNNHLKPPTSVATS